MSYFICLKIKKLFFFVLLFVLFATSNKYSRASFFSNCGVNDRDIQNITYILKNSNSNFISSKIEDITNDEFKKALYLYLFYRDFGKNRFSIPMEAIDVIGFENFEKINRFKLQTINYLIHNDIDFIELKKRVEKLNLTDNEKLRFLQNRSFIKKYYQDANNIDRDFLKEMVEKSLSYNLVSFEDIKQIYDTYYDFVSDDLLLQQVRIRLFSKNTNNIDKIKKLMKSDMYVSKVDKILDFYYKVNQQISITLKNKKGKKVNKYRHLNKNEILDICKKFLNKDEYIDLYCLNKNDKDFDYVEDILKENNNPKFMPKGWLNHRVLQVRDAINNNKNLRTAYKKIANAGFLRSDDFYTQHFLAGFVSYIYKQYHDAVYHFLECANNSTYADSIAKANYWLGLSFEKIGNDLKAKSAFKKAGEYVFTFYGQMANEELGKNPENEIIKYMNSFKKNRVQLCENVMFIAGYYDQYFGNNSAVSPLLTDFLAKNKENKDDLYSSLNVIYEDFARGIGISYAYYALRYNVVLPEISFPMTKISNDSLTNAVIKQESNFKKKAVSNKGARGFMQIMPSTGKKLAQEMGIPYNLNKLLHDEKYNIEMGQFYLRMLLDRFGGHKVLCLASYNAGALNVNKWIEKNGNPLDMEKNEDVALWIEKIPFSQTRYYIPIILGNEMVYDVLK